MTTKRLFTGADVATGAVFSAIGLLAFRPAIDPDVFWHLATGKWIWQNQAIPKADPFSWTTPGRAWIAHEWLTEAIWRLVYRIGGWGALVALSGLILMGTFALVRATSRRLGARPISATVFTALSALAGLHTWNVRPQMISLAFSALFGYWFVKAMKPSSCEPTSQTAATNNETSHNSTTDNRTSNVSATTSSVLASGVVFGKRLWLIPIIMLGWVNLHGGWVFGMAMLGAFTVATLLESYVARSARSAVSAGSAGDRVSAGDGVLTKVLGTRSALPHGLAKRSVGVFLAALLVCFVNPNGLKGVVYPFSYLGDNASTRYVNEWFAPSVAKVQYWPFFALLALFIFVMATGLKKLPLYVYTIGIPFSLLAVQSARNVSSFAVFVAPYLALAATNRRLASKAQSPAPRPSTLDRVEGEISSNGASNPEDSTVLSYRKPEKQAANPSAVSRINQCAIVAIVIASVALGFRSLTKQANLDAQAKTYPVAAVRLLLQEPGNRLLNDYDWGGYLTHIAPSIPVSIDGRPDMYGDEFTESYVNMWRTNKGWQARLSAFEADRVLAKPNGPLATNLRKSPDWNIAFEDSIAVLFARRS
jgi:hypothetical protein